MNNFNLILSKIFKQQKKISYKLLNQDVLKSIKYPTLKIMIIDNNFDFSIINNLANIFNLKQKGEFDYNINQLYLLVYHPFLQ